MDRVRKVVTRQRAIQFPGSVENNHRCWWCQEITPIGVCTNKHIDYKHSKAVASGWMIVEGRNGWD